jgi:hypothetical protein
LFAGEQFVENEACAPNVAFLVILLKEVNFRSCVQRGASAFGHGSFDVTGESEVGNFEVEVFVEKDVLGFEVAVDFVWIIKKVLRPLM